MVAPDGYSCIAISGNVNTITIEVLRALAGGGVEPVDSLARKAAAGRGSSGTIAPAILRRSLVEFRKQLAAMENRILSNIRQR